MLFIYICHYFHTLMFYCIILNGKTINKQINQCVFTHNVDNILIIIICRVHSNTSGETLVIFGIEEDVFIITTFQNKFVQFQM